MTASRRKKKTSHSNKACPPLVMLALRMQNQRKKQAYPHQMTWKTMTTLHCVTITLNKIPKSAGRSVQIIVHCSVS